MTELSTHLLLAACAGLALALALGTARHPLVLLHLLIWSAATGGSLRRVVLFETDQALVTLSGARWMILALGVALALAAGSVRIRLSRWHWPLLAFWLWMTARFMAQGFDLSGAKDVVIYGAPLLIWMFATDIGKRASSRSLRALESSILASLVVPAALLTIGLLLEADRWTLHGPKGFTGARSVAAHAVIVAALALAGLVTDGRVRRGLRSVGALGALSLVLVTTSRLATLVFCQCGMLSTTVGTSWKLALRSALPRLAIGSAIGLLFIHAVPSLSQRMYYSQDLPGEADQTASPSSPERRRVLNVSGRGQMWSVTLESGLDRPWVGKGLGTARVAVAQGLPWRRREIPPTTYPPHNEYLQVFHDGGIIGLLLLLVCWSSIGAFQARRWLGNREAARAPHQRWRLASLLAVFAVVVMSVADNTLHYFGVVAPAFVLFGIADGCWRSEAPR